MRLSCSANCSASAGLICLPSVPLASRLPLSSMLGQPFCVTIESSCTWCKTACRKKSRSPEKLIAPENPACACPCCSVAADTSRRSRLRVALAVNSTGVDSEKARAERANWSADNSPLIFSVPAACSACWLASTLRQIAWGICILASTT